MKRITKFIRRTVLFSLATVIWLHALFLWNFAAPSVDPLARRFGLKTSELVIFLLMLTYTLLRSYGPKRIMLDSLYIFFFPVVLCYFLVDGVYGLVKRFQADEEDRFTKTSVVSLPNDSPQLQHVNKRPGLSGF